MSKTIAGTGTENQFEITLEVTTTQKLDELKVSADAAVVLVMDVSNSMKETLSGADTSDTSKMRITMAKTAAKDFLEKYADVEGDATRMISVVEFGANAKTVLDWTEVSGGTSTAAGAIDSVQIGFDCFPYNQANVMQYGYNNYYCSNCGEYCRRNHTCYKDSGATNIDAGLRLAYITW